MVPMKLQVLAMKPCDSSRNNKNHRQNDNKEKNEPIYNVSVKSKSPFSKQQLCNLRCGSVFEISCGKTIPSESSGVTLGIIWNFNPEMAKRRHMFDMMIFNSDLYFSQLHSSSSLTMITVKYLTQLTSEFRCYEALRKNYAVHFEAHLLGHPERQLPVVPPSPTIARFNDVDIEVKEESKSGIVDGLSCKFESKKTCDNIPVFNYDKNEYFAIPKLNAKQDDAATHFLQSPLNTITLIQGPPGTGKTTLLVTILCRYLLDSLSKSANEIPPAIPIPVTKTCFRRIMVCAPTNKAVYVLVSRFMKSLRQGHGSMTPFNVILIGDVDKIFLDDRAGSTVGRSGVGKASQSQEGDEHTVLNKVLSEEHLALKSIFLYSWLTSVIDGYKRILRYFQRKSNRTEPLSTLLQLSIQLRQRITNSLTLLPTDLVERMDTIVSTLQQSMSTGKNLRVGSTRSTLQEHIKALNNLPADVVRKQLLLNANVIFSTLISAGGAEIKQTVSIDDLIVDEAAAATEPEIYIPFHLEPKRFLAVGDPCQLPATVTSRRATALGLARSLHQRLMHDCSYNHVMLDVQYRMNPEISSFPNHNFYNNLIQNGDNVVKCDSTNGAALLDRRPYTFLQVEGHEEQSTSGSYYNQKEAMVIVDLIARLQRKASDIQSTNYHHMWCDSGRIRVISFYSAQVSCIQQHLEERGLGNTVVVSTVDSSQGCEADIVLISFVRSQWGAPDGLDVSLYPSLRQSHSRISRSFNAGFLTDDRRMNVALTRAKYQLVCVGNVRHFDRMPNAATLNQLAQNAEGRGIINYEFSAEFAPAKESKKICFSS